MIRINLLPHRQEKRAARRQQFFVLGGMAVLLSALIVLLGYTIIAGYIRSQEEKNAFLKREIASLDKQIEQIKRLKEQTQALLSRKQIIESLQRDRGEVVHLFNEFAKQMPDGVYLKSIRQDGQKVNLTGYAQSNARVSTLMRNLEASDWLESPQLVEIHAASVGNRRLNEFNLNVTITRPKPDDEKGGAAAAGKDKK